MRLHAFPLLCLCLLFAGCAVSPTAPPAPAPGVKLTGSVHGGQQPVAGAGSVWVANATNTISRFSNAGTAISPASGFGVGPFSLDAIAVDGSGNVWLSTDSNITEVIGAATPVVTPIATGVKNNTLDTRP